MKDKNYDFKGQEDELKTLDWTGLDNNAEVPQYWKCPVCGAYLDYGESCDHNKMTGKERTQNENY